MVGKKSGKQRQIVQKIFMTHDKQVKIILYKTENNNVKYNFFLKKES